jgi:ribosome recycling factor
MQEDIDLTIEMSKESMDGSLSHLSAELQKVRSGRASPDMLSSVKVDYYGATTPLERVANVKTTDARTIIVQPWEKGMIQPIEKAILQSNLGLNPQNDGIVIRLSVPPLTEERRRQLIKFSLGLAEQAKVSVRNARRDAIEDIRKAVKNGYSEDGGKVAEAEMQKLTDAYIAAVDKIMETKEKEILTV